jgi:hypothetical protein
MNLSFGELSCFIDSLYESLGGDASPYVEDFRTITGGCHCVPPTEWFGDIYLMLKKLLKDHAITDEETTRLAKDIVRQLSKQF